MTELVPKGLVSVNWAASYLGIGRSKAYELLLKGELQSVTLGRRRLIPVTELEAFVQRLMQEASEEATSGDAGK